MQCRSHPIAERRCRSVLMTALCACLAASGCGDPLVSGRKDRDIVIDGKYDEWDGAILSFEDERLGVGIMNDDRDLYLSLYLGDRPRQIQALTSGCTLWFDGAEEGEKAFGIRAPLGLSADAVTELTRGLRLGVDMDSLIRRLGAGANRFAIVDAHGVTRESSSGEGIDLALGSSGGYLVLEMRVPLRKEVGGPPAIQAAAGEKFRLGIEMAPMRGPGREGRDGRPDGGDGETDPRDGGPGGGFPGDDGDRGGTGGGPGNGRGPRGGGLGGPRGGPGGMSGQRPPSKDALMTWIDVVLSPPDSAR